MRKLDRFGAYIEERHAHMSMFGNLLTQHQLEESPLCEI